MVIAVSDAGEILGAIHEEFGFNLYRKESDGQVGKSSPTLKSLVKEGPSVCGSKEVGFSASISAQKKGSDAYIRFEIDSAYLIGHRMKFAYYVDGQLKMFSEEPVTIEVKKLVCNYQLEYKPNKLAKLLIIVID